MNKCRFQYSRQTNLVADVESRASLMLTSGCQFDCATSELLKVDELDWCKFHAPCVDSKNLLTDKGRWDQRAISDFNKSIALWIHSAVAEQKTVDLCGVIFPATFFISLHADSTRQLVYPTKLPTILLQRCLFEGQFSLDNVYFSGSLDCRDSLFKRDVFLTGRFDAWVTFEGAAFRAGLAFGACRILGRLDCSDAERAKGPPQFEVAAAGATIPSLQFVNNLCEDKVIFSGRRIAKATTFAGSVFFVAPDFLHANVYGGIDFESCLFPLQLHQIVRKEVDESAWMWKNSIFEIGKVQIEPVPAEASQYRALRLAMEQQRNRLQEGTFYIWEQRCLAADKNRPGWFRLSSSLYGIATQYGTNPLRPLLLLVACLLVFWIVYLLMVTPVIDLRANVDWGLVASTLGFAFEQLVSPFRIWQLEKMPEWANTSPMALKFVSTMESLIGLTLVALFLLALRWVFKRG